MVMYLLALLTLIALVMMKRALASRAVARPPQPSRRERRRLELAEQREAAAAQASVAALNEQTVESMRAAALGHPALSVDLDISGVPAPGLAATQRTWPHGSYRVHDEQVWLQGSVPAAELEAVTATWGDHIDLHMLVAEARARAADQSLR